MEDNETQVDTTVEETQEEVTEETSTGDSSPTLEDYQEAMKKLKTLEAQKEHWRKKAEQSATNLKTNTETKVESSESDEERLLRLAKVASQVDDDDLQVLKSITGSSIEEKLKNPAFLAYKELKENKRKAEQATLKPSGSIISQGDPELNKPGITPEEHRKQWEAQNR